MLLPKQHLRMAPKPNRGMNPQYPQAQVQLGIVFREIQRTGQMLNSTRTQGLPFPLQHQPPCEGKAPTLFPTQNWAAHIKYRNEGQGSMSCCKIRVSSDPGCLQDWHLLGHSHLVWNKIKGKWEWGKEQLNSIKLRSSSCAAWKLRGNVKVKSTYFKNETPIEFKLCQSLGAANYSPDQLEVSWLNSS